MKKLVFVWTFGSLSFLTGIQTFAQEEQSAEFFLEEYTDEFQETFFEALKQKGIQNYDRAIKLFLECKNLDPLNSVLDYELAKVYFFDKQYIQAQEYAIEALIAKPTDFWYLESLMQILQKQGSSIDNIAQNIPFSNQKLLENLATYYFKQSKYNEALKVLKELGDSEFSQQMALRINDSIQSNKQVRPSSTKVVEKEEEKEDPLAIFKMKIRELLESGNFQKLEEVSRQAMDLYPLQPYFYYAHGKALNGNAKAAMAVEVLEAALDYIIDDQILENKIYKELENAFNALGNPTKALEYRNKIKPGS